MLRRRSTIGIISIRSESPCTRASVSRKSMVGCDVARLADNSACLKLIRFASLACKVPPEYNCDLEDQVIFDTSSHIMRLTSLLLLLSPLVFSVGVYGITESAY